MRSWVGIFGNQAILPGWFAALAPAFLLRLRLARLCIGWLRCVIRLSLAGVWAWGRLRWCRCRLIPIGALAGVHSSVVILVNGVLFARPLHLDLNGHLRLVDLVLFAKGLKPLGDNLQPYRFAAGQHINECVAVLVGLQLHVAFIFFACHLVKDDSGILNRLAIHFAQDSNRNARGRRRSLVFTAALLGSILPDNSERTDNQGKCGHEDGGTNNRTVIHGVIVNGLPSTWPPPSSLQNPFSCAATAHSYFMSVLHSYIFGFHLTTAASVPIFSNWKPRVLAPCR